jgi:cell division transport system permease protein
VTGAKGAAEGPLFPRDAAPLRTLVAAMAAMCFLAVLAVGAIILIERAVAHWSQGLATELTVHVPQVSHRDMERDIELALAVLKGSPGVRQAEALARSDSEALLAPWIGADGLDKLPVPRLIRVLIDEKEPPDLAALEKALAAAVPPARLDSHRQWEAELRRMAGTLSLLSWLVLGLVVLSSVAMVVSASRAVLAANQPTVEVLHLSGADDSFIARAIDRRFLSAGFYAGLMGLAGGVAVFALLGFFGGTEANGVAEAARSLFYLPRGEESDLLLWFLAVPLAATVIALATSRLTLVRMLSSMP